MNFTSPQAILVSVETLVATVILLDDSHKFSEAQINALNRLQDEVRYCVNENEKMVNAPDAHIRHRKTFCKIVHDESQRW